MSKLNDVTPEQWNSAAERGALSAQERGILRATKRTKEMDTQAGSKMDEEYYRQQRLNMGIKERSDGSSASYYELPGNASELQDLISDKNMNYSVGSIFMLCYEYGKASEAYDKYSQLKIIKDIITHAEHERKRLETMHSM